MNGLRRAAVSLSLVLFLVTVGCMGPGRDSDAEPGGKIEERQRFTLSDAQGQPVSLDALLKEKKAVLLNFWATWCPPCREEIPGLIRLQSQYESRGFTVLGVDVSESDAKVSAFVKKMGMNYPVVIDHDNAVAEEYRVVGIPTSLLIRSDGAVLGEYHAATPKLFEDVEEALK